MARRKTKAEIKTTEEVVEEKVTPKRTKKAEVNPDRVAVLETHIGENLTIRSGPSEEEVRQFVKEQNRRYHEREDGGPSGVPALHVIRAEYYDEEKDAYDPADGTEIDISDLL